MGPIMYVTSLVGRNLHKAISGCDAHRFRGGTIPFPEFISRLERVCLMVTESVPRTTFSVLGVKFTQFLTRKHSQIKHRRDLPSTDIHNVYFDYNFI